MSDKQKLSIGFLWHMHQPEYRDPVTGEATLPWVRLHSCCGYSDMIAHAYRYPEIGQVINLTPVLLDQLEGFASGQSGDLYLDLSRQDAGTLTETQRRFILANFFQANPGTQIQPFPRYRELWQRRNRMEQGVSREQLYKQFSIRDLRDLQVWFNLAWTGWSLRNHEIVQNLFDKGADFTEEDKRQLLDFQVEITLKVLEHLGRIVDDTASELTFTPFYHPIAPLLCDTNASLISRPEMPLPNARFNNPQDAAWHVREGMNKLLKLTGHKPKGMWPAEGSVSPQAVEIFAAEGVQWLVTDEGNVYRSDPPIKDRCDIHRPNRVAGFPTHPTLFFRERDLSDAVGFRYQRISPEDATNQLITRFEEAFRSMSHPEEFMLVLALDGENPWSYFPDFGEGFLSHLAHRISNHPNLRQETMSNYLERNPPIRQISRLHSGSWIDNDFHIWIGDPFKNRAWELLTMTRDFLGGRESLVPTDPNLTAAWSHMHIAEGSDWFWWYGEPNHSDTEDEFDRLFRGHLQQVYRLLGEPIPVQLFDAIGQSNKRELILRVCSMSAPIIDGRISNYYEWLGAGYIDRSNELTSPEGDFWLEELHYGYDTDNLYLRLDFNQSARLLFAEGYKLYLIINEPVYRKITLGIPTDSNSEVGIDKILEQSIPLKALGLSGSEAIAFSISIEGDKLNERFPGRGMDIRCQLQNNIKTITDWIV